MNIDPLDTAYLAIGAQRALDEYADTADGPHPCFGDDGQFQIIGVAISFVPLVADAWAKVRDAWDGRGVWAYEVSEELGAAIVIEWMRSGDVPSAGWVEGHVRTLVAQAMK